MDSKESNLGRVLVISAVLKPDEILEQLYTAVINLLVQHLVAVPLQKHTSSRCNTSMPNKSITSYKIQQKHLERTVGSADDHYSLPKSPAVDLGEDWRATLSGAERAVASDGADAARTGRAAWQRTHVNRRHLTDRRHLGTVWSFTCRQCSGLCCCAHLKNE